LSYLAARATSAGPVGNQTAAPLKPRTEDLMFVLRDEPKKLARVEELLYMKEVLDKAQKVDLFEGDEEIPQTPWRP